MASGWKSPAKTPPSSAPGTLKPTGEPDSVATSTTPGSSQLVQRLSEQRQALELAATERLSSAVENASKKLEMTLSEAGKAASASYTAAIAEDLKAAKADAETLRDSLKTLKWQTWTVLLLPSIALGILSFAVVQLWPWISARSSGVAPIQTEQGLSIKVPPSTRLGEPFWCDESRSAICYPLQPAPPPPRQ